MTEKWDVETATGRCAVTGNSFEEGEEFYTVLIEDGELFKRQDYSLKGWNGPPEGAFCHFKTRVPVKEKRKQLLVNNHMLFSFFERLADEEEPARVQFRFVLALILMRKRLLRYDGSSTEDGVELWNMTVPRDKSSHRVVNPRLTDDQIATVSAQLGAILHSDMGEWAGDTQSSTGDTEGDDTSPEASEESPAGE